MRRTLFSVVALLASSAVALGDLSWQGVTFDYLHGGAFSYDASGDNVVVSGSAFYNAITSGGYLGTQIVGGDGIDDPVYGNFAVYGVFSYTDNAGVLGWLTANPNTPVAIEIRAWGLRFTHGGGDNWTLDAKDMAGTEYLSATFAELGQWGYTDIADAETVWLDLALMPTSATTGYVAMSVVMEDFVLHGGAFPDFSDTLLPGVLQGYTPGVTPGSGIRVAQLPVVVPVPGAALLAALGVGVVCRFSRRRAA
jgi:hypothetical protein